MTTTERDTTAVNETEQAKPKPATTRRRTRGRKPAAAKPETKPAAKEEAKPETVPVEPAGPIECVDQQWEFKEYADVIGVELASEWLVKRPEVGL